MKRRRLLAQITWTVLTFIALLAMFLLFSNLNNLRDRVWDGWKIVYLVKTLIEVVACCFALFYLLVALNYRNPTILVNTLAMNWSGSVTVAYLCCNDLDYGALESVFLNCSTYDLPLLIHDDSTTKGAQKAVDQAVENLLSKYHTRVRIIRRTNRTGGKPGATNNIIQHLEPDASFLLLCDSDSFLPELNVVSAALPFFQDPQVALVQFRNIGRVLPDDSKAYRVLAESIDFYDSFVNFMDRFGWSPFLGHNAMLRVSALKEVGGFTLGQLADDIDFAVKLRFHGYRAKYAQGIACGERHPMTYQSLRLRTRKWAFGCTQILLRWSKSILISTHISLQEKLTFFLTVGFYHFQSLLLLYLVIFYILLPFNDSGTNSVYQLLFSAGLILFLTFIPSITYFAYKWEINRWPIVGLYLGFTYGSQDFVILNAICRCLLKKSLPWAPTNGKSGRLRLLDLVPELLLGGLIVIVALLQNPILLLLPTTILFAGKFLVSPLIGRIMFRRYR